MKRITCKKIINGDTIVRKEKELKYQLNYGIADLMNKALLNEYHLPIHHCDPNIYPDYIALNTEKSKFHFSPTTALAFYTYDKTFDKLDGLYNAIQYKNQKLLRKYKQLYAEIKFVIAPDYSLFDDIWLYENESRLFKIRVIMLWFVVEIGAIVIPNAIYISKEKLPKYLSGLESCTVICFSTKGHVRHSKDRNRIRETVKYVVDNFPLKTILVYSVCGKDETSLNLFSYAISKGIQVKIIDNTLRRRNIVQKNKAVIK